MTRAMAEDSNGQRLLGLVVLALKCRQAELVRAEGGHQAREAADSAKGSSEVARLLAGMISH